MVNRARQVNSEFWDAITGLQLENEKWDVFSVGWIKRNFFYCQHIKMVFPTLRKQLNLRTGWENYGKWVQSLFTIR